MLSIKNLQVAVEDKEILRGLNLDVRPGEVHAIMGPNGSGKSTLLKALGRLLKPTGGAVYLNGKDLKELKSEAVAKHISVLPQSAQAPGDMTVRELAACGRIPYQSAFSQLSQDDEAAVEHALKVTGLTSMQYKRTGALSGGERQRAWLAMALAQEPKILLLDEPTTFLDVHYQLELMDLVVQLHEKTDITVIMVMHDLNHAARFSHRLIAVKGGEIVADGPVREVFCKEILETLYDVNVTITEVEENGRYYPMCFPYLRKDKTKS